MTTCMDFIDIENILCIKHKGFTKLVVPFSLKKRLLELARSKVKHPQEY